MRSMRVACGVVLVLAGCGGASLTAAGAKVAVVDRAPAACTELAPVEGSSGGHVSGGGWVSNDALREGARNDARNRAALEGATAVWLGEPSYETNLGTVVGVRVAARAWKCQ